MIYEPKIIKLTETDPIAIQDWKGGLLIRATNWLGDALMTLPAVWQMKRLLPEGVKMYITCPANLAPLWRACKWVDGVQPMEGGRLSSTERQQIRHWNLAAAVILPNSFGSAWDVWRCGIPRRIGRRGRLRSWLLTDSIPEWKRDGAAASFHQLSWYLNLAAALGKIEYSAEYPSLKPSEEFPLQAGMKPGERWLVLAPGAAYGPAKQWPVEYYAEIARRFMAAGGHVVLVGSKKDIPLTAHLTTLAPGALDLGGRTSLDQLMSVLARADYALCNDSGNMHLAAACGTDGIAIFGSTDPTGTGPLGARWNLQIAQVPCRPCFRRTCPLSDAYRCLHSIPVEQVWRALQEARVL